jgi:RNA polymerase sigma factor (sigma-70 family)
VPSWMEWVASARSGDRAAFDEVVRKFRDMAVGYAYTVLRDFHLAEDAAQEAFVRAFLDLGSLEEPAAFPAWLRRVVHKYCDRITRRRRLSQVPYDEAAPAAGRAPGPAELAEQGETRSAVLREVEALPENERVVATLYYIDGYSTADVGGFLEVPVSTVKNRLYTARRRLRERMADMVGDELKKHAPGEELNRKVSRIIEGIERIGWKETSCLCFVGSVAACMRFLGEKVGVDHLMGVSGGAFKTFWHPSWAPSNCDLLVYGVEPIRQTFSALGYEYRLTPRSDRNAPAADAEEARRRFIPAIVEEVDAGHPVIAQGIVGPPECCVVTGYDDGGRTLRGWSYFQSSPENYFSTSDWACYGLIRIGRKVGAPPARSVLRSALAWGIRLVREPSFEGTLAGSALTHTHANGLAAYDEMAAALLRDRDFEVEGDDWFTRVAALGSDGLFLIPFERESAARFLDDQAELGLPGKEHLRSAASAYRDEVAFLKANAWPLAPHTQMPMEDQLKIKDRSRRQKLSRVVLEVRTMEERAVAEMEKALGALGGSIG